MPLTKSGTGDQLILLARLRRALRPNRASSCPLLLVAQLLVHLANAILRHRSPRCELTRREGPNVRSGYLLLASPEITAFPDRQLGGRTAGRRIARRRWLPCPGRSGFSLVHQTCPTAHHTPLPSSVTSSTYPPDLMLNSLSAAVSVQPPAQACYTLYSPPESRGTTLNELKSIMLSIRRRRNGPRQAKQSTRTATSVSSNRCSVPAASASLCVCGARCLLMRRVRRVHSGVRTDPLL